MRRSPYAWWASADRFIVRYTEARAIRIRASRRSNLRKLEKQGERCPEAPEPGQELCLVPHHVQVPGLPPPRLREPGQCRLGAAAQFLYERQPGEYCDPGIARDPVGE